MGLMRQTTAVLAALGAVSAAPQIKRGDPAQSPSTGGDSFDYSQFTVSKKIPFKGEGGAEWNKEFNGPPHLPYQLEGREVEYAVMDTGSGGWVISPDLYPGDFEAVRGQGPKDHVFYTSSNVLESGERHTITVTFPDAKMTAEISVLVVTNESTCPEFRDELEKNPDAHECPIKKGGPITGFSYMGVGFDRGKKPDPNGDNTHWSTLLNIKTIDDKPVGDDFCSGYVIKEDGVHVGITKEIVQDFKTIKLEQVYPKPGDLRWQQPPVHWKYGITETMINGQLLVDTGIGYTLTKVPDDYPKDANELDEKGRAQLKADTPVSVVIGNTESPLFKYDFKAITDKSAAPPAGSITPPKVALSFKKKDTDIIQFNTGSRLLRKVDLMIDNKNGYFGLHDRAQN